MPYSVYRRRMISDYSDSLAGLVRGRQAYVSSESEKPTLLNADRKPSLASLFASIDACR